MAIPSARKSLTLCIYSKAFIVFLVFSLPLLLYFLFTFMALACKIIVVDYNLRILGILLVVNAYIFFELFAHSITRQDIIITASQQVQSRVEGHKSMNTDRQTATNHSSSGKR